MKHFIIDNKLWERFLNYDEFIMWLRKEDSDDRNRTTTND